MINWQCIESFIGYGRIDAPVVFLGMEEGGPSEDEPLKADLIKRSSYRQVEELGGGWRTIQRTWWVMCITMLRRSGIHPPTRQAILDYQSNALGKAAGDTLLAELMPYPKPSVATWPDLYRDRFTSRKTYFDELLPQRVELLRTVLSKHPRELVVCYGKGHWDHYAAVFGIELPLPREDLIVMQAGGTRYVFCHHFVSPAFNTTESKHTFTALAVGDQPRPASAWPR